MEISSILVRSRCRIAKTNVLQGNVRTKDIWSGKAQRSLKRRLFVSQPGVLRYAAEYKDLDEPLRDFVKRTGGLNACAARFALRLGRGRAHEAPQARCGMALPLTLGSLTHIQ